MMHRIKYSKSLVVESGGMIKNGLSVLLLKFQKGLVPSPERLVVSDVGGVSSGFSSAAAAMGSRRFFNTGGRIATESSSLMKRDMFRAGDLPNLFRGWQTGGCVGSFVPHQCNKSHMLPYFARSLASSSASQSSGQTPRQEPKKKKERQIERSSELQRERCDEISSTEVSLNQFPRLMVPGNVWMSKTRRLLRLKPDTGYFEEEQDVSAAAASNHHGHYELQVPHMHLCRGSAYGWLFLTDDNLDMKLLNPFSGAEIQLPPVQTLPLLEEEKKLYNMSQWFVTKAVFSANPSIEPRPVVLIIYGGQIWPRLAFCKPGDKGWTPLESSERSFHMDAIYHKGQFYVLGYAGYVAAFDIGRRIDDDDHSVKTIVIADPPERRVHMRDCYLVVLDGELVRFELRAVCFLHCCRDKTIEHLERVRKRDGDTTDEDCTNEESDGDDGKKECLNLQGRPHWYDPRLPSCTYGIKIRRFDVSEKRWVKVESLGDKAVFLGFNTSFAISASDYPTGVCIPDSVYFTGVGGRFHSIEYPFNGGRVHCVEQPYYDMGIYNVKDKSLKPLYPSEHDVSAFTKPPPIWIVNSVSDDIDR